MKNHSLVYSLIVTSIFLVISFMFYQNYTYNKISSSFKISENKYDFLESSNLLINKLRNLESYQRGYLLTNNKQFLEEYNKNKYQLNLEKDRFYKLTARYTLEENRGNDISQLRILIDQKVAEMDSTINHQKNGLSIESTDLVDTNLGLGLMNNIIEITQKLNTENKYKETIAKQAIYKARALFKQVNYIILSLLIVCLIFIGFYVRKCIITSATN